MLSESVECFLVIDVFKHLSHAPSLVGFGRSVCMNLLALVWSKLLASAFSVAGYQFSVGISKPYFACGSLHITLELGRTDAHHVAILRHLIRSLLCHIHDDKALSVSKLLISGG